MIEINSEGGVCNPPTPIAGYYGPEGYCSGNRTVAGFFVGSNGAISITKRKKQVVEGIESEREIV